MNYENSLKTSLLSAEEYLMIKEVDEIDEKKRLKELVSLDELQNSSS